MDLEQTEAERWAGRRSGAQQRRALKRRARLDEGRRAHIEHVRRRDPEWAAELEARWFGVG